MGHCASTEKNNDATPAEENDQIHEVENPMRKTGNKSPQNQKPPHSKNDSVPPPPPLPRGNTDLERVQVSLDEKEDENVVFADTLKLTSIYILRALSQVLGFDPTGFCELAITYHRKDANYIDLIAHRQFDAFFRSAFDLSRKEKELTPTDVDPKDVTYLQKKFELLLNAVERSPYKKPPLGKRLEYIALLQQAAAKTRQILDEVYKQTDNADHQSSLAFFSKALTIFEGDFISSRVQLYTNIDRVCK